MITRTTNLHWLLNTIAHEWTHNFLTLRPLGVLYEATPELRTMNETTASIVGTEIGDLVMQRYYPEQSDASPADLQLVSAKPASPNQEGAPPAFDFHNIYCVRGNDNDVIFIGWPTALGDFYVRN